MDEEYDVIVLGTGLKECILVTSIQDAKDHISQIEYVFCSQLYPHFKSDDESKRRRIKQLKRDAGENAKLLLHIEERRNVAFLKSESYEGDKATLLARIGSRRKGRGSRRKGRGSRRN